MRAPFSLRDLSASAFLFLSSLSYQSLVFLTRLSSCFRASSRYLAELADACALWTVWLSAAISWLSLRIFWCWLWSSSDRIALAWVLESTMARVSRFDVSRDEMRARKVSISPREVALEDLRV